MKISIAGLVIIFICAGALLCLECLNRQEKNTLEQIHQGLDHSRAEVKKRQALRESIAAQQLASLNQCTLAAETADYNYGNIISLVAPRKRGQLVISQAILAEIAKTYPAALALCRQNYETRVAEGI
jgi:hypothetical protein